MKNKVLSLTKVFLKNSFKTMKSSNNKPKTGVRKMLSLVAYIFLFIYLAGVFGFLSYNLITSLAIINQEQVFISIFFLAVGMLLIIQSVFSCMNVFYLSKDIEFVLPLPLKPSQILMAKFNTILVTEYITETIFALVPLVLYGVLTGCGALYYIMAIIALLVFPIFPIIIGSLVVMIVMSFSKIAKNKDKFQLISTIIIIGIVVAIQFLTIGGKEITDQQIAEKLVQANSLVDVIGNYFVTLKPITHSIINTNIIESIFELSKVLLITAGSYILFILLGKVLYLRGAVGSKAGGAIKNKNINIERAYKRNKISASYIKKEFKILFRNPVFFIQCILPSIIMPIIFLVIGFASGSNNTVDSENSVDIGEFISGIMPFMVFIILGITQFLSMMTYISATAISRDGQTAVFTKYIPVSLYKQFIYKSMPNFIMNLVSMIIIFIIMYVFVKPSLLLFIPTAIIAILFNIIQSYLMLIVDLKKPKLEWDTEYAVVKQNINLIWTVIYGFITIGAIVAFAMLNVLFGIDLRIVLGIFIVLLSVITYIIDRYIYKNQYKLFEKIY